MQSQRYESSQRLVKNYIYYDFMALVYLNMYACLFDFVGRREVHGLKVY